MRILLVGGSKSGKSMLAQRLTKALGGSGRLVYWASMEPFDREDELRIAKHVKDRDGWGFETVERGRDLLAAQLEGFADASVLFDSVTALLANEMFEQGGIDDAAAERALDELLKLSQSAKHFVCVCDDVFRDGAEYDETTELYRRGLAHICRGLAAQFDTVCEVVCGIPKALKGELPEYR